MQLSVLKLFKHFVNTINFLQSEFLTIFFRERALFFARAVVYYFDSAKKSWAPTQVGNSFCRLDMYENPSTNSYRVIGRGLQDTMKVKL